MNNIIELRDFRPVPDQPVAYTPAIRDASVPLIIDNGSYQCRAGWAINLQPALEFRNLIAKPRRDRNKPPCTLATVGAVADVSAMPPIQVGNEIANIEAMRFQLKTQFDRNVVTHLHNTEQIFDYVFRNLSVTGSGSNPDGGFTHPIVLTEALANPNYSRALMSELLFECYDVPQAAYGVDALFSYAHSRPDRPASLIVSCGYHTTDVIPLLDGRPQMERARRLNLGGHHMTNYLHRLLQLKYPVHTAAITLSRAEWLLHSHCTVAEHYGDALGHWRSLDYYEQHVKKLQLPYTVAAATAASALTAEQRVERRREMAKRLADMNARRREEKLAEDEVGLQRMVAMRELWEDGDHEEFEYAIGQMEIGSIGELEKQIQSTHTRIHRTKAKIASADGAAQNGGGTTTTTNGGGQTDDGSARAIPQPPGELSIVDWVRQTRQRRSDILERRHARRQRRQDLARRRTAAAQERMRVISQLARKEKGNDDFGARDEDWDVYKTIRRETGDSDSEAEQERLIECEDVLRHHDPEYEKAIGTPGGSTGVAGMTTALVSENTAELYQLHVGVEAIRSTEILFQPSMLGSPEAGLAEIIEYVLRMFSPDEQQAMVDNVFLTGGCASFPGLTERLTRELREMRPFESTFNLGRATEPSRDAWLGARQVAAESTDIYISREDYAEKGGDYLREHRWSNAFFATPAPIVDPSTSIDVVM